MELAGLLLANLNAVDQEPESFLDGKLLVSKKRQLVEVDDSLTYTEALTISQMVICASHPHHWSDLIKYKLLIIQTANNVVVYGYSMTLPLGGMLPQLVHLTDPG